MNTGVCDRFEGDFRFLSNFYPCAVVMDDVVYPSVEHAYQAAKCADKTQRERFAHLSTAGKAKYWGRRVSLRPDWDAVKGSIMGQLLLSKFKDPGLREKLIATDRMELVEGNHWHDTYWGVCEGIGENRLGQMLMWVRDVCRLEDEMRAYELLKLSVTSMRECARLLRAAPHREFKFPVMTYQLTDDGVVVFPGGFMHPYSFRDIMGEERYQELLKQPRVPSLYPGEFCNYCEFEGTAGEVNRHLLTEHADKYPTEGSNERNQENTQ